MREDHYMISILILSEWKIHDRNFIEIFLFQNVIKFLYIYEKLSEFNLLRMFKTIAILTVNL